MLPSERATRRRLRREFPDHLAVVDLPHGVAAGDVTPETAVVWTRTAEPAVVHVEYATDPDFARSDRAIQRPTDEGREADRTVSVRLRGLRPGTRYYYRVWALSGAGAAELFDAPECATTGRFHTAPSHDDDAAVSFVWTGDTYGQRREPPYQVPRQMAGFDPDCFLYLGDTIYADSPTPAVPDGEPESVDDYRAKYREVREEATNLREFLARTAVVPIWDDHEVANDWAGTVETRLPAGRQAFFEYWPVDTHESVTGADEHRLYRSFRWGERVELFVLDTRQYRDDNGLPDGPEKTMLGAEQREWLKDGLETSDATFALVASSTSLSSPSSDPDERDSWASGDSETGFESELLEITGHVREAVDSTVVWLTGDRHFARLASFDLDRDGQPEMYEAMASPMGAWPREPGDPDATLAPTVHFEKGGKYEYGEFYNFGHVEADDDALRVSIYDKVGERQCTVEIDADGGWPTVDQPDGDGHENGDDDAPTLAETLRRRFGATVGRWL